MTNEPRYRYDLAPPGWKPPTREDIQRWAKEAAAKKARTGPIYPKDLKAFPKADGTNGLLVCRMTSATDPTPEGGGGYAPLHAVGSLDNLDDRMAKAGFNMIGQVVSIEGLDERSRVGFCKSVNRTTADRDQQGPRHRELENATWAKLPRLTGPGMDIDVPPELNGTREARDASLALVRKLIAAEAALGVGIRASWSGGEERGRVHLDWVWDGSVAEPHLLRALYHRVVRTCAKLGVATDDTRTEADLAWVDLVPLNHWPGNRGRLWRPVGGLRTWGARKVPMDGHWGDAWKGAALSTQALKADIETMEAEAQKEGDDRKHQQLRKRKRAEQKQVWLIPCRREELDPLREFLQQTVPGDGPKRHGHRMAWAEVLRASGFRDRDTAWLIASSHGNVEDSEKLVENTRQRHEAGARNRGKGFLETELGVQLMDRYADLLGRIKVKGAPKVVKPKDGAKGPVGDLRRRVRATSGLSRQVKDAMVAYSDVLEQANAADPAVNALRRPSTCRTFHERVTCRGCRRSRGVRRTACEDELCAWCHGSRVLHEHALALAAWRAAGVKDVLAFEVWGDESELTKYGQKPKPKGGHPTSAELSLWIRQRSLGHLGLKMRRVNSIRYVEPTEEKRKAAKAAGLPEPKGQLECGVLLLIAFDGWAQAVLRGAEMQSCEASLTRYTLEGAAERAAVLRWGTHVAYRTAACLGEFSELARTLRDQFRHQASSGGKTALYWPGRADARESIVAEVRARREAIATATANGGDSCGHDGEGQACECDPAKVKADYELMSSGRDDAVVVHRQEFPHSITQSWRYLRQFERHLRLVAEHVARKEARELAAVLL
ncbi:hypothetical protein LCGC14_0736300 [marine sediment metagenome]|uniref:Uncharacterized protein n=1 Tax=marine sediment metagenome TaxID=412755 RepID=A0A0F9QSW9_9ZZZZ